MRYLLLDRIIELSPPAQATAVKCITLSEDFFADHFPCHPVMPGALVIEALAQLGAVLLEATLQARGRSDLVAIMSMVDRARFRRMVRPGDRLDLAVEGLAATEDGGQVRGRATVEGQLCAEAEIGFAMLPAPSQKLLARRRGIVALWRNGSAEE
jgi:3-hydroxymyristoyl/3-hydroxydecanoyl-(acyl carrier protein) dehydratase